MSWAGRILLLLDSWRALLVWRLQALILDNLYAMESSVALSFMFAVERKERAKLSSVIYCHQLLPSKAEKNMENAFIFLSI